MATAPKTVNRKGDEIVQYPKLVKTVKGKVRVNNAAEEDALEGKIEAVVPAKWPTTKKS